MAESPKTLFDQFQELRKESLSRLINDAKLQSESLAFIVGIVSDDETHVLSQSQIVSISYGSDLLRKLSEALDTLYFPLNKSP